MEKFNKPLEDKVKADILEIKNNYKKNIWKPIITITTLTAILIGAYLSNPKTKKKVDNNPILTNKTELSITSNIQYLTESNIDSLLENSKYSVINITAAEGCPCCKVFKPNYMQVANENTNSKVNFYILEYPDLHSKPLKTKYQELIKVEVLPTTKIIEKTEWKYKIRKIITGNKPEKIKKEIKKIN
jgi:hypothetical protein